MQVALPPTRRGDFNRPTLTLLEGTFLDDTLCESESDLLYEVEYIGTQETVWLYLLFEHQSSPDAWMRFRLLKYCCRIWDASIRTSRANPSCDRLCRWCSTRVVGRGRTRRNLRICFPRRQGCAVGSPI